MSLSEICAKMASKGEDSSSITDKNILDFLSEPWGLGLGTLSGVPALYPAQRFIIKLYYGLDLDSSDNRDIVVKDKFNETELYRFNETEYMHYLYNEGRINRLYDGKALPNMVLACGRRSGKTTLTACIIAYELYRLLNKYCPQEYYGIMPEDNIYITCVSTSRQTAKELFDKVTGHMERAEYFRKYRQEPTQQWMYFRTQRDIDRYGRKGRTSVGVRVAPCNAKGLRGPGNIIVAFDEMAFFFMDEETGLHRSTPSGVDRNDELIYKAVTPSVAKFKKPDGTPEGRIICISSPGAKMGKFYDEFERGFKDTTEDLFVMQAPSWEIDPTLSTAFLKSKYLANPISFKSEFGAEFSDQRFGWMEDASIIRRCIVPGLQYKTQGIVRVPHFLGMDVGLKEDGTAITVGHWVNEVVEGVRKNKLEIDYSEVRFAKDFDKEHWLPEDSVEWVLTLCKRFSIHKGLMDQYYGMAIVPLLHQRGQKQFEYRDFTAQLNSTAYSNLLTLVISEEIRFPVDQVPKSTKEGENDSALVQELLTLQAEHTNKYLLKVKAPEREGMHDDLSDSLARMALLAAEYRNKGYTGTAPAAAHEAKSRIRMVRMMRHSEFVRASLGRPSIRISMGMRGFYSPLRKSF